MTVNHQTNVFVGSNPAAPMKHIIQDASGARRVSKTLVVSSILTGDDEK